MEDGIPFNKHYSTLPLLQQTLQILYGFFIISFGCEMRRICLRNFKKMGLSEDFTLDVAEALLKWKGDAPRILEMSYQMFSSG